MNAQSHCQNRWRSREAGVLMPHILVMEGGGNDETSESSLSSSCPRETIAVETHCMGYAPYVPRDT